MNRFVRLGVLALIACIGCASETSHGSDPGSGEPGGKADWASFHSDHVFSQVDRDTGTGNHFSVKAQGLRAYDYMGTSEFRTDIDIEVRYEDRVGYFHDSSGAPQGGLGTYAHLRLRRAHHGSYPTYETRDVWFGLARDAAGQYEGKFPLMLSGGYGDNQEHLDGIDFAFVGVPDQWDSDYGHNYPTDVQATATSPANW